MLTILISSAFKGLGEPLDWQSNFFEVDIFKKSKEGSTSCYSDAIKNSISFREIFEKHKTLEKLLLEAVTLMTVEQIMNCNILNQKSDE